MAISPETLQLLATFTATVDDLVDTETRRLIAAWVRAWDQLTADWRQAIDEIIQAGPNVHAGDLNRLERVQLALNHTAQQLDRLLAATNVNSTGGAAELVDLARQMTAQLIASQYPTTAGATATLATTFDRVPTQALQWIVERTTNNITALSKPLTDTATEAVKRSLIRGITLGQSPREAAKAMLLDTETAFNGGLVRALTIARTEMLDAHRAAAKQTQDANADVLAGWMWCATLDDRTCESCWAMDGRIFPLEEEGPDDHQNGRCARMPVTKTWRELGFDLDEPDGAVRPAAHDVFRQMTPEQQLTVMGPTKLAGLNDGSIRWEDLATERTTAGWRRSFVPTPVGALAR